MAEVGRKLVQCVTVRGEPRAFPAEQVRFRPAAYGVAVRQGQALVARSRFSGLWEFPGGAVQPWERLEEGLQREYQEETGLAVTVGECLGFDQGFIAFFQHAFNSLRFFYRVEVAGGPVQPQADEVVEVRWVSVHDLSEANMAPNHHRFLRLALGQAADGGAGGSAGGS